MIRSVALKAIKIPSVKTRTVCLPEVKKHWRADILITFGPFGP